MSQPISETFASQLLADAGRNAYCEGRGTDAAKYYADAAEHSRESRNVAAEVEAKRWEGNSLMWSGRHEEALLALLEVATCEHPRANPVSVFGAKTDCIMLSLFHAKASACREMINDAARYLAGMGKMDWRHRLDLLTCALLMKQGRFAEAAEAIAPAYRRAQASSSGPQYSDHGYFKWNARPAFFLQQENALAHWERMANECPVWMISDQLQRSCIRLFRYRLLRAIGKATPGMLEEALQAARIARYTHHLWDETFDIARALILAGEMDIFARLPITQITLLPFDRAAVELDLQINIVRHRLNLPAWDADLNWPPELPHSAGSAAKISPKERNALIELLAQLEKVARSEDERMETNYYSNATELRRKQTEVLLKTT